MEELSAIINNIARLIVFVGGGASVIAVGWAGFLWMTGGGDPQKMSQARMALFGAIGGVIIMGAAFIVPRVISQFIIEPAGGQRIGGETGVDCDGVLQSQLIVQRASSSEDRMNAVVSQIQTQRDECSSDVWDPAVNDASHGHGATADRHCFGTIATNTAAGTAKVGSSKVPRGLISGATGNVRATSGRDSDNNIIVFFDKDKPPTDGAKCWLYRSALRTWDENY